MPMLMGKNFPYLQEAEQFCPDNPRPLIQRLVLNPNVKLENVRPNTIIFSVTTGQSREILDVHSWEWVLFYEEDGVPFYVYSDEEMNMLYTLEDA